MRALLCLSLLACLAAAMEVQADDLEPRAAVRAIPAPDDYTAPAGAETATPIRIDVQFTELDREKMRAAGLDLSARLQKLDEGPDERLLPMVRALAEQGMATQEAKLSLTTLDGQAAEATISYQSGATRGERGQRSVILEICPVLHGDKVHLEISHQSQSIDCSQTGRRSSTMEKRLQKLIAPANMTGNTVWFAGTFAANGRELRESVQFVVSVTVNWRDAALDQSAALDDSRGSFLLFEAIDFLISDCFGDSRGGAELADKASVAGDVQFDEPTQSVQFDELPDAIHLSPDAPLLGEPLGLLPAGGSTLEWSSDRFDPERGHAIELDLENKTLPDAGVVWSFLLANE